MNTNNQLEGFFSKFDDRRGDRNGSRTFSNDRGGFRNQRPNDQFSQFSRRNNNATDNRFNSPTPSENRFDDFRSDYSQNDRSLGLQLDHSRAGGSSNNGNASNRSDFGGNDYGGNGNGNCSGNYVGNRNDMNDINTVHLVLVRGMPFYCDEMDIYNVSSISFSIHLKKRVSNLVVFFSRLQFFAPTKPIHCKVLLNDKGQHSGKAEVYFGSREDVAHVMRKNREKMGSRYIELFDANENHRSRF